MPRFQISVDARFKPLFVPMGLGPRHARVTLDAQTLRVRLGWAFRATVPLASVRSAAPDADRVTGWGAHGWGGIWLVNGSSNGLVRVEIEPPVRAWVSGFPVQLRALRVSLQEPDAFVSALREAIAA